MNFNQTQPSSVVGQPDRANLQSQGGTRGSRLLLAADNQPIIVASGGQHIAQGKPRATSAYGTSASRRNLQAHAGANERQSNAGISGSGHPQNKPVTVKDRKMQMRVVGSSTKTNNFMGGSGTPSTNGMFVEQPRVAGIGHGFGT